MQIVPAILRKRLGRVYRQVIAPAYRRRARQVLRDFTAHHQLAKAAFIRDGHAADLRVASVEEVGVRVLVADGGRNNFLDLPANYLDAVDAVYEKIRPHFDVSAQCSFFPGPIATPIPARTQDVPELRRGDVIAVKLLDPLDVPGLEDVCGPLMQQLERHVFASYALVDKVHVYRSVVGRQCERMTWLWHFDNHPREILKVMIYLTDVDAGRAPFEYLRDATSLKPVLGSPLAPLYGDSRITEDAMKRYRSDGHEVCQVTGPRGTTIVFDNNVVHRAVLARTTYRDVLVFQVRPVAFSTRPYIDRRWTGSFGHADFTRAPSEVTPSLTLPKVFER